MITKYTDYKVDDFFLDNNFLDWVLYKKDDVFWSKLSDTDSYLLAEMKQAKELIHNLQNAKTFIPENYNIDLQKKLLWEKINKKVAANSKKRLKIKYTIISVAASLLIFIGIATMYYMNSGVPEQEIMFIKPEYKKVRNVQLILADGIELNINEAEKSFTEKDGTQISNNSNRTLIYNKANTNNILKKEIYNQIIIPRGKRHNIVLADGPKVWINSESSLRFPTQFINNKRIVFLEGEAYFDVAPNKNKPFIVKTASININVTGTSFNVKAYDNDNLCETTLEKGLVEITGFTFKNKIKLTPGKKTTYSKSNKTTKTQTVNTKLYTSWKNGKYIFQSEPLESLIIIINRWYNVNVICEDTELLNYKYTGEISENRSIEHIMQLIHMTSKINYTINDKNIVITK